MKRKIKYQAWHKLERKMYDVVSYCCSGKDDDGDVEIVEDGRYRGLKSESIELREYISLKDKNGKEIYTGDIVQTCYDFSGADQSRAYVVIEHATCGIRWIPPVHPDDVGLKPLYDPSGDPDDTGCLSWDLSRFEVVGNIYENPEMLT